MLLFRLCRVYRGMLYWAELSRCYTFHFRRGRLCETAVVYRPRQPDIQTARQPDSPTQIAAGTVT